MRKDIQLNNEVHTFKLPPELQPFALVIIMLIVAYFSAATTQVHAENSTLPPIPPVPQAETKINLITNRAYVAGEVQLTTKFREEELVVAITAADAGARPKLVGTDHYTLTLTGKDPYDAAVVSLQSDPLLAIQSAALSYVRASETERLVSTTLHTELSTAHSEKNAHVLTVTTMVRGNETLLQISRQENKDQFIQISTVSLTGTVSVASAANILEDITVQTKATTDFSVAAAQEQLDSTVKNYDIALGTAFPTEIAGRPVLITLQSIVAQVDSCEVAGSVLDQQTGKIYPFVGKNTNGDKVITVDEIIFQTDQNLQFLPVMMQ